MPPLLAAIASRRTRQLDEGRAIVAQLELLLEDADEEVSRRVELLPATRDEVVVLMRTAIVAVLQDERMDDDEGPGQSQDRS